MCPLTFQSTFYGAPTCCFIYGSVDGLRSADSLPTVCSIDNKQSLDTNSLPLGNTSFLNLDASVLLEGRVCSIP